MATPIQLLAAFILFCFSIANAYSSLAHWITTSDYFENKMFKDLTSNGNDPIRNLDGDGSISSGVTCASFKTASSDTYYGVIAGVDESSTTELGISVWLYALSSAEYMVPLSIGSSASSFNYLINVSPEESKFKSDSVRSAFTFSRDKWIFLVFYFVKNNNKWDAYAFSPEQTTSHVTSSSFPGKTIIFTNDGNAFYYEIQVFTKAVISGSVVTLSDSNGATYIATTTTCPAACSGGYCHPEIGCLSTTTCYCSSLCDCSGNDGVCTSCKDTNYGVATECNCKIGFILYKGYCVFGNFYTDVPPHCVDGTSQDVCTQCQPNYFLYDKGATTKCLSCDSCDTCSASPNCYECVNFVVQDGSTCRVDSIGYQVSFESPNIVIDFAHALPKNLKMHNFKATTENNQDISTTGWAITGSSTPKQYQIFTDLTESQLPINLDFTFEQDS